VVISLAKGCLWLLLLFGGLAWVDQCLADVSHCNSCSHCPVLSFAIFSHTVTTIFVTALQLANIREWVTLTFDLAFRSAER